PLKTPPHIAPVWYFTPFYSILRATTSTFMWALIVGVIAYVLLIVLKTRLHSKLKIAAAVIGIVAVAGMLVFDAKFWGVVLMGVSVLILAGLPWLDRSAVKSIRYRPTWHASVYLVFGIAFLVLGYLGVLPPTPGRTLVAQICTFIYFGFFLLMPWWSTMGKFRPVPERVTFQPH
ncbi:MAG TPA: cytochrome bc complex cytochrome b subunit, partial [Noviherbaspirillum sp.]